MSRILEERQRDTRNFRRVSNVTTLLTAAAIAYGGFLSSAQRTLTEGIRRSDEGQRIESLYHASNQVDRIKSGLLEGTVLDVRKELQELAEENSAVRPVVLPIANESESGRQKIDRVSRAITLAIEDVKNRNPTLGKMFEERNDKTDQFSMVFCIGLVCLIFSLIGIKDRLEERAAKE